MRINTLFLFTLAIALSGCATLPSNFTSWEQYKRETRAKATDVAEYLRDPRYDNSIGFSAGEIPYTDGITVRYEKIFILGAESYTVAYTDGTARELFPLSYMPNLVDYYVGEGDCLSIYKNKKDNDHEWLILDENLDGFKQTYTWYGQGSVRDFADKVSGNPLEVYDKTLDLLTAEISEKFKRKPKVRLTAEAEMQRNKSFVDDYVYALRLIKAESSKKDK